ncbi:MAG: hypothetical protein DDT19_01495 [Syntrophomonadaceae bacterium]|nr:hypothetical protein [Bacillota bacterium]
MRKRKGVLNNAGFTLIEFVAVVALIAVLAAGAAILIGKARESAALSEVSSKLRTIEIGLTEFFTYRGNLPTQGKWPAGFPVTLHAYISPELRTGGKTFDYACGGNHVWIRTSPLSSPAEAANVATKLRDAGICSHTHLDGLRVLCILQRFTGNANC